MKKINTLFLLFSLFPVCNLMATFPTVGDGSSTNPYKIATADQLISVRDDINRSTSYGGKVNACYELTADIDLSSVSDWGGIGTSTYPFSGSFDGKNHYITGLKIGTSSKRKSTVICGFFNYVYGVQISNLTVWPAFYTTNSGSSICAGLIGQIKGGTDNIINNCRVKGTIDVRNTSTTSGSAKAAGIVGQILADNSNTYVTIINSRVESTITAKSEGSGLICYAAGFVAEPASIATVDIINCFATTGSVSATNTNNTATCAGGIIASCYNTNATTDRPKHIINCYADNAVDGHTNVGGIVGLMGANIQNKVSNCVALNTHIYGATGNTSICRISPQGGAILSSNYAKNGLDIKAGTTAVSITSSPTGVHGETLAVSDPAGQTKLKLNTYVSKRSYFSDLELLAWVNNSNTPYNPVFGAYSISRTVAGNIYVNAATGNDTNNGTSGAPYKTISKAAAVAIPGDVINVSDGTYRERISPARGGTSFLASITYKAINSGKVIIKGSDVWSPIWTDAGTGVYYATPDDAMFDDDCYVDNKNPFEVTMAVTPYGFNGSQEISFGYPTGADPNIAYTLGQVFVDGEMYIQKPFLSGVTPSANKKTWWYDKTNKRIYIHFADDTYNGKEVEISTRRRIFAPHKRGLEYINVQGFVMEHCGNQYPANFWTTENAKWQQAGALGTRSGKHWSIYHNVIRFAGGIGIDFGNEGNSAVDLEIGQNGPATGAGYHTVDANYITDNGAGGTAAYNPTNITFTNNRVERNNNLMFVGDMRWESAGVKMHNPANSEISKNLIQDNYKDWQLWLDTGSGQGTVVKNNLIVGGNKYGFDLEAGATAGIDKLMFFNNILINNKHGISFRNSGGTTAMNNLIINSGDYSIINTVSTSRTGEWQGENIHLYNNLLLKSNKLIQMCEPTSTNRSTGREFLYNVYETDFSTTSKFIITNNTTSTLPTLTLENWKVQLKNTYGLSCYEQNSSFVPATTTCTYNPATYTLTMNVAGLGTMNAKTHASRTADYFETSVGTTPRPGPFQNIRQDNTYLLWNGLQALSAGANPSFIKTMPTLVPENEVSLKYTVQNKKLRIMGVANTSKLDIYSVSGSIITQTKIHSDAEFMLNTGFYIVSVQGHKPFKICVN